MTAPEICDAAGRGEKPEGLDAAGELLWYRVSDIYAAHKRGTITPAEGKSQKAKAVLAYNMDHAHIEGGKAAMQRTAEFFARVEIACDIYRHDRTIEHADAMLEAIHGQ